MVAPNADNEQVRYDILIEAKQAIEDLKMLGLTTADNTTKIQTFSNLVLASSKEWQVSWQQALNVYKELNAELSKQKQGTLFGRTGGQDLFAQSQQYIQSLEEGGRITGEVTQKTEEMGSTIEKSSGRAVRGIDAVRIALGALVAMIVFNVIQAFQNMFGMAINGLRELETATYNLVNAEKKLSEQGIQITPTDLSGMIAQLQKLDPLLSKIQATELVSSLSTKLAPALGLSAKQIDELGKSIVVLAIRNKGLGKSFEEVQSQVENAFLSGRVSTGINQLGVKITDQIVKDEALRLGLVATAKEFDNLSGAMEANVKAQAMVSLLSQNTGKDIAHLPDYFKTADAAFGIFQARLQDFFTDIGVQLGPLLIKIFTALANALQQADEWLNKNKESVAVFVQLLSGSLEVTAKIVGLLLKFGTAIGVAGQNFVKATEKMDEFLKRHPLLQKMAESITKLFPEIANAPDTPTSGTSPFSSSASDAAKTQEDIAKATQKAQDDIQKIMQDSADKKLDIERDYQRKLYDINRDYNYKLEDIARKTAQKEEDALRSYNQKVEDINRNAEEAAANAKQDARNADVKREEEYQLRLKELREKFLMDLEDALRNRDARQVLRLIRQYNMDKQNLEDKHKLDEQQAKQDLAQKLKDIERERQLKLEAARREYEQKLEEIKIAEQRENEEAALNYQRQLEDARIWHDRQLEEQRQYLQRKLRDLATALQQEFNLSASAAQALVNMFAALAGTSLGGLSSLGGTATSSTSTSAPSNYNPANANTVPYIGNPANANTVPYVGNPANANSVYGHAEGGTLIATRPTKALFGERGPERVDITPLGKVGNQVGNVFGDKSALGMGGSVRISLELSPDLEARIVDNSLEGLAVQLEKVIRSKS